MNLRLETVVDEDLVRVIAEGEYLFEELFPLIEHIQSEADRFNKRKVLFDGRLITGDMTEAERFQGGQKMASAFGATRKVALLMPPKQITRLGELAAVNRGANVFVSDSEQEALNWLA